MFEESFLLHIVFESDFGAYVWEMTSIEYRNGRGTPLITLFSCNVTVV